MHEIKQLQNVIYETLIARNGLLVQKSQYIPLESYDENQNSKLNY